MSLVHVAGNPALDFVGTVAERGTADLEELGAPDVLAHWYVAAGLVDVAPRVTAAELQAALRFREHLHTVVVALSRSEPMPTSSRSALNRMARRPGPIAQVGPDDHRTSRGDADACLAAVAHAALDLFDRTDGAVVRFCADERCTHPFLDRSRDHRRRWCDMATCGDRAKVRRYRESRP